MGPSRKARFLASPRPDPLTPPQPEIRVVSYNTPGGYYAPRWPLLIGTGSLGSRLFVLSLRKYLFSEARIHDPV